VDAVLALVLLKPLAKRTVKASLAMPKVAPGQAAPSMAGGSD